MHKNHLYLSAFGYDEKYIITYCGQIYNTYTNAFIKRDCENRVYLKLKNGDYRRISIRGLYKKAFNKQLCIDRIINLKGEIWKCIENTDGTYYISNYGRIKSLFGYNAITLSQYKTEKGYLTATIKGKTKRTHRLVAQYFLNDGKPITEQCEVHHKDRDRTNNKADNLIILTKEQHLLLHNGE